MPKKSWRRYIRQLGRSLGLRVLLLLIIVFTALFFIYTNVYSNMQYTFLEQSVKLSALRSGDLIRKSTFRSMLRNDRPALFEMIHTIGSEPGIERIRIYNKDGEIMFSTEQREAGNMVSLENPACIGCHSHPNTLRDIPEEERFRVFRDEKRDERLLGLIVPIYNQRLCWDSSCHFHERDRNILGVLDVQFSMQEFDGMVAEADETVLSYSIGLIAIGLLLVGAVIWVSTFRPLRKLREGTETLATGNLGYRINLKRHDELGDLAVSFNSMAANLEQAYNDLKHWSHTLEEKVDEKTTELKRIHEEIVKVERISTLGKMAATVAHELNNPLSGILNYSRLLQKKTRRLLPESDDKKKLLENLELIASESMRCGTIVKNLLVFARGSDLRAQMTDLREIVERARKLMAHHFELGDIKTSVEISAAVKEIECDANQIMQALVALMVNAVEAMPEGGNLKISVCDGKEPGFVRLAVSDDGMGIPDDIRDKIFEPFFSSKENQKGAGLGLSVVYGIVQRHRGQINVTSKAGKGSTFIIDLPLKQKGQSE